MLIYQASEFIIVTAPVFLLLAAVALVSYAARSRLMFVAAGLACFLGLLIPEPTIYWNVRTMEGATRVGMRHTVDHLLFYGAIGAAIVCGLVFLLHWVKNQRQMQFSLRAMLSVTAAIAIGLAAWKWPDAFFDFWVRLD